MIEIKDETGSVLHRVDAFSLLKANLANCYLRKADFRGAILTHANLRDADLREADLTGADLSHAKLEGAKLNGAKLPGAKLDGAALNAADLTEIDGSGASFIGATLDGATLVSAGLSECLLTGCTFNKVQMKWVHFRRADLSKCRFEYGCVLEFAQFDEANLTDTTFRHCNLQLANFQKSNLDGTKFESCDLKAASMEGTDLSRCGFDGSKVSKIHTDRATVWPNRSLMPFWISLKPALFFGNLCGIVFYFTLSWFMKLNFMETYTIGFVFASLGYMLAVRYSVLPAWNFE